MSESSKKSKSFTDIASSIAQIIKKPLSQDEIRKINSILEETDAQKSKRPPKAALPSDTEPTL